ncbi:lysine histidine transporter-like 8 [Heracleum sosnowskyi]|uniref:Lysine histidine transporter-like 8 n=1 Tax=Heracleum sosnowskyi TaxID=360622 RepID=A0AAD8H6A8_9APIA|nr:lysine histidine transporter-like 8 [Heracleum sosnowskyi]
MEDSVEINIHELVQARSSGNQVLPENNEDDPWLLIMGTETVEQWLPITESRQGGAVSATFLLICSGMGLPSFALPVALVSLGWYWGIISFTIGYVWQLYTIWLLVNLHESVPPGIRCSRFMHLSITAFGMKLGKLLSLFPIMYLSGGTCVLLIINGGSCLRSLYVEMWGYDYSKPASSDAEWCLLFIIIAVILSQFSPNLDSAAKIAALGSLAAAMYSTLLVVLSLVQNRPNGISYSVKQAPKEQKEIYGAINALGLIAFAFRGHNVILDIQGTISTCKEQPSRGPMNRAVSVSYLVIAACFYPLTLAGYWCYGNKLVTNNNMPLLRSFMEYHHDSMPKFVKAIIYLLVVTHFLTIFQIYGMVVWDNLERIYVTMKNRRCPKWLRGGIRALFGGFVYFVAVELPFLGALSALLGAITAVPITFIYPCLMWIIIRNPGRTSPMWYLNVGLAFLGIALVVLVETAAIRTLIVYGFKASFFDL